MNEAKHTPGPWIANCFMVVAPNGKSKNSMSYMYGGQEVCHTGGGKASNEEAEANARLIAAAPDLLAACKAVEWIYMPRTLELRCPKCGRRIDNGHAPDCQLAAAIRAAEGEDS